MELGTFYRHMSFSEKIPGRAMRAEDDIFFFGDALSIQSPVDQQGIYLWFTALEAFVKFHRVNCAAFFQDILAE